MNSENDVKTFDMFLNIIGCYQGWENDLLELKREYEDEFEKRKDRLKSEIQKKIVDKEKKIQSKRIENGFFSDEGNLI